MVKLSNHSRSIEPVVVTLLAGQPSEDQAPPTVGGFDERRRASAARRVLKSDTLRIQRFIETRKLDRVLDGLLRDMGI